MTYTPELSVREVNKGIRAEWKAEKARDKAKVLGTGTGVAALHRAEKAHPHNPKAQICAYMENYVIMSGTGRKRPVSARTNSAYGDGLMRVVDDLRAAGAPIRNLSELGKSHVLKLIRYWMEDGQANCTIQNKISILRRFLTFIGKANAIPRGELLKKWLTENGIEAPTWSTGIADISKTWEDNGVDLMEVLEKVSLNCPLTAIQLEMQAAFGLRVNESLQINPSVSDHGNTLRIMFGTKGGLPRDVAFDEDPVVKEWQRDVLQRAKKYSEIHRRGLLAHPRKTLEQAKKHFYYQVSKVGISRKGLGVTAHGLRHQYAARRYRAFAGMASPLSVNAPLHITPEVLASDLDARKKLTVPLGHFRADIPKSYIGSFPTLEKQRQKRVKEWITLTEENPQFQQAMREAGIQSVWLGGHAANGLPMAAADKLRVIVQAPMRTPLSEETLVQLTKALDGIYFQRGVDLSEHRMPAPPDDALHIVLRNLSSKDEA